MPDSSISVIPPKRPKGDGWEYKGIVPNHVTLGYEGHYWFYPKQSIFVISALEVAQDKDGFSVGPEYHISISKGHGKRCNRNEARFALKAFGMEDSKEDNHVPGGYVRNFWMPVAEKYVGRECECVKTENTIKEDKGDFEWRT